MIQLTRLTGSPIALNADQIERIDSVPDTVITMLDGRKYVVSESTTYVIEQCVAFRAAIVVAADDLQRAQEAHRAPSAPLLRLVSPSQDR
jgi:flagellar protein FlbD